MIDMNKKYTFAGETGSVVSTTRNNKAYAVVWIGDNDGGIYTFTSEGRYSTDGAVGLIEVKPTHWVNIYRHIHSTTHHTKKDADDRAGGRTDRIACIEFTEGEGIWESLSISGREEP